MKIKLPKNTPVNEAIYSLYDHLISDFNGMDMKIVSGSVYLSLVDKDGTPLEENSLSYILNDDGSLTEEKKREGGGDVSDKTRGIVRERILGDIKKNERQLQRDVKKLEHAKNMHSSSIRYNRKDETIKSWKMEKGESFRSLESTKDELKDLKDILRALDDNSLQVRWHTDTFSFGQYRGRTGVVLEYMRDGRNSVVYCFKGLFRISGEIRMNDFRDKLILV